MRAFAGGILNPSLSCIRKIVSYAGFSRYRDRHSCVDETGFILNLGGTVDFCIVRPKLVT